MDAASALRRARSGARLTQTQLAERADTSQAAVSAYENGSKTPTLSTLQRLLHACGMALELTPIDRMPRHPTRSELEAVSRQLMDVLDLAARLPTRDRGALTYPRLPGTEP